MFTHTVICAAAHLPLPNMLQVVNKGPIAVVHSILKPVLGLLHALRLLLLRQESVSLVFVLFLGSRR